MHIAVIWSIAVWTLPATTFGLCTTLHPQTVTAYTGERLSYTCEASCGEKFWKLNGSFAQWEIDYPYRAVIADGWRSTLSIEASAATNNSVVTCFLYNPPNNEESSATITVQGTVAKSTNLTLTYNEENIYFSWNRPHTLPNTQLIYAINLSILNCSKYNISFTTANTQVSIPYTSLNINRCNMNHTVSFTVIGVNRAGESEPSFVQAVIPRSQEKNCSQAINQFGPPIDVIGVIEEKSLTLSWQPPLLMLAPGVMLLCYKISVNVTESLDPQNILTQFMSNCTYNTTYTLSLSSIGINQCNGHYLIDIHVVGVSSAQVEGDFARIEVISSSSIQSCLPKVGEDQVTVGFVPTTDIQHDSLSSVIIYIVAAVIGSSLLLGLSVGLIVLLTIKKHRSKTLSVHHDVENLKENGAYGISSRSMKSNDAYGSHTDKESPMHIYEEISAKEMDSNKSTIFKKHDSPNRSTPMELDGYGSA